MNRLLAPVVAAVFVLTSTAGAASPAYGYDPWLGTIARTTLWQSASQDGRIEHREVLPVAVRCYLDRSSFEHAYERHTGKSSDRVVAYYAGGRDVHLRPGTCANVRLFFQGRHTVLTAGAYAILVHESLHRQGLVDERLTTCFANEAVRWGTRWFGFSEAQALRARNLAFTYTRLYASPSYRMGKPNCLALNRRQDWVDQD